MKNALRVAIVVSGLLLAAQARASFSDIPSGVGASDANGGIDAVIAPALNGSVDDGGLFGDTAGLNLGVSSFHGNAAAPPVPEPTTVICGVLLLLPFGASALRIVRRNRAG